MADEPSSPPPGIDTSVPHSARIWNYWLGGKDNFAVDRAAGDAVPQVFPGIATSARADRAFLAATVTYLAAEAGIRQFLDIGTGLPTDDNTHEVAQAIAPESRIVYVDNDPLVLVHARALLTSTPEGATDYIDADLRDPEQDPAEAAETLDFDQPVALMLMAILGHIPDYDEAHVDRHAADGRAALRQLPRDLRRHRHRRRHTPGASGYNESGAIPYQLPQPARRSRGSSTDWSWSSRAWSC